MHSRRETLSYFRKMLPTWYMVATDANRLSGRQATLWDPSQIKAKAYKSSAGILISTTIRGINIPINILNIYVPYKHRAPFWSKFFSSEIFDIEHLILVGDFNFTLNSNECWGHCRHFDSLADSIKLDLLNNNMVDVVPGETVPTWSNGQSDQAYIAKRIDRFLVYNNIIDVLGMPHSSVENILVSDHRPIMLTWPPSGVKMGFPFKFNHTYLHEPTFNELIINVWKEMFDSSCLSPPHSLREKLSVLKKVVKDWEVGNKKKEKMELQLIQQELDSILRVANSSALSFCMKCHLRVLFASLRRNKNAIWKINNENGDTFVSQQDISWEAVAFFKQQYTRRSNVAFQDLIWGIELAPLMFDDNANATLYKPVLEEELLRIMKCFQKDKSLGPDGWTIDFLIHFFDLFKKDILDMVEASRTTGTIHHHSSSTLISLIPKKSEPTTFKDFCLISLCNISFKIIMKIIAEMIKGYLATFLSMDKYAFLRGRNILDAVANTQECLSSLSTCHHAAAIMKIDLHKAFDCVDWGFVEFLLTNIGLMSHNIRWILACIMNVNYAVIVNGFPTHFFQAKIGLRQGCPLSPLLFILIMNTLSLHINKAVADKIIRAIRICRHNFISHNIFVDDVLLFAMLCKTSWV
eukprot:PITA_06944